MKPAFETDVDGDALQQWRRQATDIVLAASVVLHLPVIALFLLQYFSVIAGSFSAIILGSYLVTVLAAVFRGIDHRIRAWAALGAIDAFACVGILAFPEGPYVRLLPIMAPIFAIGVLGIGAARIATLISAIVLLSTPLIHSLPDLLGVFGIDLVPISMPAWLDWVQATALTSEMIIMMVLLERSYDFLLRALDAKGVAIAEQRAARLQLEEEMHERLRLEREVASVSDEERRQLGIEVHDGVCQQLTGALLRCQALEMRLEQGSSLSGQDLEAISSLVSESINEAHAVAQGLWPLESTPQALSTALRRLVRRTQKISGVSCEFRTSGDVRVTDPAIARHVYRIAQEALSNAVRHAHPSHVTVELHGSDEALALRVEDDGIGLRDNHRSDGMGLRTMTSRAQILEAEFTIVTNPKGGTRVQCCVPRCDRVRSSDTPKETVGGILI